MAKVVMALYLVLPKLHLFDFSFHCSHSSFDSISVWNKKCISTWWSRWGSLNWASSWICFIGRVILIWYVIYIGLHMASSNHSMDLLDVFEWSSINLEWYEMMLIILCCSIILSKDLSITLYTWMTLLSYVVLRTVLSY